MSVTIVAVQEVTDELVEAFRRLLPQLSASAPSLGNRALLEIVQAPSTTLLIARNVSDSTIVGAVTLVVFRIPTGTRARIESLVVDASTRGRGIGQALCRAALASARDLGADTVDLTSSGSRDAANGLYKKMGFQLRDTNVYRYSFPDDDP